MTGMTQLKVRPEYLKGPAHHPERRRYARFGIILLGSYLRVLTREEFTCRLGDISISGANIVADTPPQVDELVVTHFDELGGLEGKVVRVYNGGFAIEFTASHKRRQKLAAQITWLINRHELSAADQRRPGHERISVAPKPVRIAYDDGTVTHRDIIDVSISGASIDMRDRPPIGSEIMVGQFAAKVVRHHERGIGVEFAYIQPIDRIREDFG